MSDILEASPVVKLAAVSRHHIDTMADRIFEVISDVCISRSKHVHSDVDRAILLEAIPIFKSKHLDLKSRFVELTHQGVLNADENYSPATSSSSPEHWSVVHDAEGLDRSVAITNLIRRLTRSYESVLREVMQFLTTSSEPMVNPIAPNRLVRCLIQASSGMDERLVRLLLEAFERVSDECFKDLYYSVHQLIQEETNSLAEKETVIGPLREPNRSILSRLQARHFGESIRAEATLLCALEGHVEVDVVDDEPGAWVEHVRQVSASVLEKATQSANAFEQDALSVTTKIFENLLVDETLTFAVRNLIARLQIPILRLVITDPTFLSRSNHPGRLLINRLAQYGVGWDTSIADLANDPNYIVAESVVTNIVQQDTVSTPLFETSIRQLDSHLEFVTRKVMRTERRIVEYEEGRATLIAAKRQVQTTLNNKLRDIRLPRSIFCFLNSTWSRVLVCTLTRFSSNSDEWRWATNITDKILQLSNTPTTEEGLDTWGDATAALCRQLHQWILDMGMNDVESTSEFSHFKQTFQDLRETSLLKIQTGASYDVDWIDQVEEICLVEPLSPPVSIDDARNAEIIDRLVPDTWVEINGPDGPIRMKICYRNEASQSFILVNEQGLKTREVTEAAFVREIQNGSLRILNDSTIIERAIDQVLDDLYLDIFLTS